MVNEDFSQPFFVGINNPRFRHQSADGYLAALESTEQAFSLDVDKPKEVVVVHRTSSMTAQESDMLQQAWRKIDWLQKKLLEKEKRRQEREQNYY